jgi:hypothetical protein
VWFTYRKDWDPAVGGGLTVTREWFEHAAAAVLRHGNVVEGLKAAQPRFKPSDVGGLARIGVAPEDAPITWREWAARGYVDPRDAQRQEAFDRELGSNPDDWRVSLAPVPASKWIAVEVRSGMRHGERWEPIPWPSGLVTGRSSPR